MTPAQAHAIEDESAEEGAAFASNPIHPPCVHDVHSSLFPSRGQYYTFHTAKFSHKDAKGERQFTDGFELAI